MQRRPQRRGAILHHKEIALILAAEVSTNIAVIVAVIAAIASISASVIAAVAQRGLQSVRAKLDEKAVETTAKVTYKYEAQKRLYEEYQPLLFQLVERSESALTRICMLAKAARDGRLGGKSRWLSASGTKDYFLLSTVYRFLAPLAIINLMQRRLTYVDLGVDADINKQYTLAKRLYRSFTTDHDMAEMKPPIDYDIHAEANDDTRLQSQKILVRQGVTWGRIDNAVETLILRDGDVSLRVMSYGQFEDMYLDSNSDDKRLKLAPIVQLFVDFHPEKRPILWRILIYQAVIYSALIRGHRTKSDMRDGASATPEDFFGALPWGERPDDAHRRSYDWRPETTNVANYEPFDVVTEYIDRTTF
jgi:hypothetical protein